MPTHDSTATASLAAQLRCPAYFGWLDFLGAPLRVTTFGADVPFSGTGDPDLDGHTFEAFEPGFIDAGDVVNREGGSDTLTITLSGIASIDSATLAIVYDRSKWWRRPARLWKLELNEALATQGAIVPYYTGYMVGMEIVPTPLGQTIEIRLENYLLLLSEASNRDYQSQAEYDSADQSGKALAGTGNGASTGPGSGVDYGGVRKRIPDADARFL